MCDEFFCRGCQRHKKVVSRSATKKVGGALCCNSCEEKLIKLTQPKVAVTGAGEVFSISAEHIRTSRIKTANRRVDSTVSWLIAHCPSQ